MGEGRVLGVDACKAGWVGIALGGGPARAYFAVLIEELVLAAESDGPVEVIAIDIPIGLPDSGRRKADEQARAIVGPRRASSVFTTPVRTALEAGDYAAAVAENRRRAGQGISRQAWGLRAKLLQVDHWARQGGRRVVEVHPEVCFARLAGRQLTHSKATWAGVEERRALLSGAGIILTGLLGAAGAKAGVDDVLDAAAAAWTAQRVAVGRALCVPDIPETFSDGIPAAIWA
jgi:predicted RNase H-like nuclease